MNLLTKVEIVAEYIITYFFRQPAESIQPVQVARELLKTMFKNKQVSVSNVYVPNVYRVYLHKDDYAILESFGETFLVELAKHLYDQGCKQGFTFLTLPVVEINIGDNIDLGGISVKIEFNDSLVVSWQVKEEKGYKEQEELEKTTLLINSVKQESSFELNQGRKSLPYLEVIKGKDAGKVYYLDQEEVMVGRNEDCDIKVDDVEISRQHLRLVNENRRWFVQDLGSTNGTFVNKLRVDRFMVNPGDRIKAGRTFFRFNVEK